MGGSLSYRFFMFSGRLTSCYCPHDELCQVYDSLRMILFYNFVGQTSRKKSLCDDV